MIITEKVLRDIFSPFGEIADVAIKKHTIIQVSNFYISRRKSLIRLHFLRSNIAKADTVLYISSILKQHMTLCKR